MPACGATLPANVSGDRFKQDDELKARFFDDKEQWETLLNETEEADKKAKAADDKLLKSLPKRPTHETDPIY